jgi:protein-disulfide isomerase
MLALLILAALVAAVSAGCGGSSQTPDDQQASKTTGSPEQKAQGTGSPERSAGGRLGHPALGAADAPVVLIEYSDYQ